MNDLNTLIDVSAGKIIILLINITPIILIPTTIINAVRTATLIVVTHFGSKYSYQQNRRRIKLVYKLLICAAALSIVELPSIFHLKYDMDHDNYICTSARYNWEMKSARYLHHLIIYPDDQELGIELVVPSLDTNADNIDRELFPKTDQHGTVWYSGKSKYVLYFEVIFQ